ncbi:unnamed protein product [Diatraea saccharalis]|uniref:Uncharacterized protein n=1 Tax=Diatraea saccharalis TaxID=40085 RepID=A0A9N9R4L9_9NEOP|nr:unnamed protein product [Diatraea saccharalis]
MKRILCIFFLFLIGPACNQLVSNIRFLQHATYMLKVVEETVHDIEDNGWCILKIPEIVEDLNFYLIDRNITGKVTYKNGFVHTIEHVDVLTRSVQQRWLWNATLGSAVASLESQLRLHNVVLGFDVIADIDENRHHYTATVTHGLIAVNFAVVTFMSLNETDIRVTVDRPLAPVKRISYVPQDDSSDMIGALYKPDTTRNLVMQWSKTIQPMMEDVVVNRVVFPTICYDCAA